MCFCFGNYPVSSEKMIFCCTLGTWRGRVREKMGMVSHFQGKVSVFPTLATAASSEISQGLVPWRGGSCILDWRCPSSHLLFPSRNTGRQWTQPRGIPELGVPNASFWKKLEIHLEEHKNGARLLLVRPCSSFSVTALRALGLDWL